MWPFSGVVMSTQTPTKKPLRIETTEDVVLRDIVRFGGRANWSTKRQRDEYALGMDQNSRREYGKEYLQWLIACMAALGPSKGWTIKRFVMYLNDDKRYEGKIQELKNRRDSAPKPTKGNPIDGTKDFLAEAEQLRTEPVVQRAGGAVPAVSEPGNSKTD